MINEIIATGYFAAYNLAGSGRSLVHLVTNGNKPLCDEKVAVQHFQWCTKGANLSYVECDKCRKIYGRDYQKSSLAQLVVEALYITFECSEAGQVKVPFEQLQTKVDESLDILNFRFYCNCGNEHEVSVNL